MEQIRQKKQSEARAAEVEAEKRRKSQMAELTRAKQDAEERQMKQIAEERKREKEEDRLAREAIKQKIAQDRADKAGNNKSGARNQIRQFSINLVLFTFKHLNLFGSKLMSRYFGKTIEFANIFTKSLIFSQKDFQFSHHRFSYRIFNLSNVGETGNAASEVHWIM